MNALLSWNGGEWWHVAGWTMLHFLWLGALVGLAAGACRFVLRRAEANTRYVVALVSLAVLAALPVGIAAWLAAKPQAMHVDVVEVESPPAELMPSVPVGHPASESAGGPLAESSAPPTIAQTADPRQSGGLAGVDGSPNGALPLAVTMFETAARHLPWLWLVGTPLTFVLLATGVIGAERLRRASCPIKNGPIADTAARLADALQISRQVSLAVCERIAAPVLVGIVRPIILLPPAALTGWSPEEIEMVLLHELAHVRRWDNLVNLAQRCVESLLFFHPAVWLVSNWVRREREACCDAVVVGRTNRPHAYAELLVALAAQMPRSVLFHPGAASAMSAGPLRGRIRRILKLEDDPMLISGKSLGIVMSGLLLAATLVVLNLPSRSRAEESADAGKGRLTTEDTESTEVKQESPKDLQRKLNDIRDRKPVDGTTPDDATEGGVFGARRVGMGGSAPVELNEEAGQRIVDALEKNPAVHSASIRRTPEGRQMLYVDITEPPGTKAFLAWDTDADGRLTCSLKFIDLPSKQSDSGQAKESVDVRKRQPTTKRIKTTEIAESTTATDVVNWLSQFRIYQDLTNEWPPKEIEFDSDLDRDTATLAWYVLRKFDVRVMPATERELQPVRERGYRGGVKVVRQDGRPSILIQLQGEEITSFDDLRKVLIGLVKAKPQVIKFRELIGTQESDYAILRDDVIASRKFPTLEDQKLADLVWARLGLELEPIGEADWKRVQAFGYQGGLRVANRTDRTIGQPLETGDILVGLHVWPTTSLKDVASVLNRDDLAELNPLKYYIVGQQPINERMDDGEVRTVMKDAFETGRISVNLPELAFGSTPTKPRPAVAAAPGATKQSSSLKATAPTDKPILTYDGKTFDEWRNIWQTELSTEKRLEVVKALAAFGANGYGKEAAEAILDVVRQLDWTSIDSSSAGRLKTACLEALAGGSSTGGYRIPTADWLPRVIEQLQSAKEPFPLFCIYLFPRLAPGDESGVASLLQLGENDNSASLAWVGLKAVDPQLKDQDVLSVLRAALKRPDQSPQRLQNLIGDLLINEPWGGGGMMPAPKLRMVPELEPLLFHPDLKVRQSARWAISFAQPADAPQLMEHLLAMADDGSPNANRLDAIRALAAMGPEAKSIESQLRQIARDDTDPGRFAAAVALMRIRPEIERWGEPERNRDLFGIDDTNMPDGIKLRRSLEDEQQTLLPAGANGAPGGGGFF